MVYLLREKNKANLPTGGGRMISLEKLKQMRVSSYLLEPEAALAVRDLIHDLEQLNRTITALIDRQRVDAKVIADLEGQIERLEGCGFEESGV
jgi:hypothetical protein